MPAKTPKQQELSDKIDSKIKEMGDWKWHPNAHTLLEQLAELRHKCDMMWSLIEELEWASINYAGDINNNGDNLAPTPSGSVFERRNLPYPGNAAPIDWNAIRGIEGITIRNGGGGGGGSGSGGGRSEG